MRLILDLFIGFFGERYGWHISDERDTGSNDLLFKSFEAAGKVYPWIDSLRDRSVTELEARMIIDRLYNGGPKASWFYFRDPYYIDEVDDREKHQYKSEGPGSYEKLQSLKAEIIGADLPTRQYNRPVNLAEFSLEDLKEYIENKYPADITLSPEQRENFRHTIYERGLRRIYLANDNYYLSLDRYISSDATRPILISGVEGIGKSALIANWVYRHAESHPEDIVVAHFIGCSPSSASYSNILWRIMYEVNRELDYNYQIPSMNESSDVLTSSFSKV